MLFITPAYTNFLLTLPNHHPQDAEKEALSAKVS